MSHAHVRAGIPLGLVTVLLSIGGCAFTAAGRLARNAPASPSARYVSGAPWPAPSSDPSEGGGGLGGRAMDLKRCLDVALERNPATRQSWERVRAAAARVGRARSAYLPAADLTAGASRADAVALDRGPETGPANTFEAGVGVRYLLFDGGARAAGLRGAEEELLGAEFRHNAALLDVALDVEESYYRLLAARAVQRVAEHTVRQTQYHVDVARARHHNGLVARSDVLKAETERAGADLLLVQTRSQVRIARGQLANAMGLRPSESFEVKELPRLPPEREMTKVERLMTTAAAQRPELRAALAEAESARARVGAGQAGYWPKVTVDADYGRRNRTVVPDRSEWSLGLRLTMPLFDGLDREYEVRRARADMAESVAAYDRQRRAVELEVWTAYAQLIEADQAVEAARALVASAEESARATEGEYKSGTVSIVQVTDAETDRTTAKVRLVQTRLDWHTALARLWRAVGRMEAPERVREAEGEDRQ